MILTPDQQQVKALLTETITLLCKNGLHFQSEFSIEGLIGITLDQKDVFLINIKETIKCDSGSVSVKCNSRTKADQLKRASPTSLRSKKFGRTNESNCAETLNKLSHGLTNISSVSLDESAPDVTDSSDVKMEFSSPDQTEYSQPVFEDSQLRVPVPLTVCHNSANRTSISSVSDGNIFSENVDVHDSLEPLSRRLCRTTAMAISESSVCNDTASDLQENPTFDSKVCKSEPLDVVEIPDDEVESSANSENSYLMYLSMYGNGREGGNHPDVGYSIQYDELQINQHSLPGCSSWDTASRVNNFSSQDKRRQQARTAGRIWKKRRVAGKGYQCRDCGKMLSTLSSLKLHCQSIHNGLFQLTCPVCGKGLWRENDLKGHMANKHDMQKEFKCDICGKEFGYKSSLKDHLTRIHGSDHAVLQTKIV